MHRQLKRAAVRGVGWAFFSSVSARLIQVATTLTLAKLLVPADFGVFALASLVINGLMLFRDAGFAQVLIYRQGDITRAAGTAFYLSLGTSALLAGALYLSAPVLGLAFSSSRVVLPIQAMSGAFIVSGAANVPLALLDRELRFKSRAFVELAGIGSYAGLSIILAAFGFGAWSLVLGWTALTVVSSAAAWLMSGWHPAWQYDREEARTIIAYGKHLMLASLLIFAFFHLDHAAVGKWLGVTAVGFYSMAFTVCNMPATNLAHVVNRVMFPTYSRIQEDLQEMRKVYLQTIRYISMAAFPAAVGIFMLAGPVITVVYGDKWAPAIPLFRVLAFYGLIRSIGCTSSVVFMSTGRPELARRVSTIQLALALPLVYPVARAWGGVGVALLFTGAYVAGTIYALACVQRILGLGVRSYAEAGSVSLVGSALGMLAAVLASRWTVSSSWVGMAVTGLTVGVTYAGTVFLLDRRAFTDLARMLQGV